MSRGVLMTGVGIGMVLAAVVIALMTAEPMPVALAAVGIVFMAIGARQRRETSPRR